MKFLIPFLLVLVCVLTILSIFAVLIGIPLAIALYVGTWWGMASVPVVFSAVVALGVMLNNES